MALMKGKIAIFNHKGKRFVDVDDLVAEIEVPSGTKGVKGDKGEQGLQGIQGVKGDKGDKGEQGVAGEKGEQGVQGVQGVQGIKGDTGNGFSLAKTYPSVDEMNADFSNPDIELHSFVLIDSDDLDNGKLYIKNETEYSFQSQLSGVKGDKGDTGEQGVQGIAGTQGDRGIQGIQGVQGPQGERGLQGIQGPVGPAGKDGVLPSTTSVTVPSVSNLGNISQNRGYVIGPIKNFGFQLEFLRNVTLGANSVNNVFNLPSDLIPIANHYFKTVLSDGRNVAIQVLTSGAVNVRIEGGAFTPTTSVYMNISFTYV